MTKQLAPQGMPSENVAEMQECKHDHLSGHTCPCCDHPPLKYIPIPNDLLLHYLRNPFGHSAAILRRARLQASDMLEAYFNEKES